MDKAIITVVGKDTVGILAKTCTCLAENGVNILDISQTVRSDYFNMMMIVDFAELEEPFGLGLQIKCQKAEIFEKMHRI